MALHPLPQSGDWIISAFPVFHFHLGTVGEAVITGAVVGNAVAHCFNEDGFAAILQCHSPCFFGHFAYSEDIVPIYADGVNTVAYTAASDAITAVLLQGRCRDCVAVVAANEDHGARACSCYIKGGMEVTLAGCTFAEVAGYNPRSDIRVLESLYFKSVGCAGGLGDLCCQR